jgi:hypothetical protein
VKRFHLVKLQDGTVHGLDVGLPIKSLGNGAWIGTTGEPNKSYSFWKDGLYYGTFRPPDLHLDMIIHAGVKGDTWVDRKKWVLEDFDEQFLLLKEWKDRDE